MVRRDTLKLEKYEIASKIELLSDFLLFGVPQTFLLNYVS